MNNEENGEILDRAVSEIRDETIDPAAVSQAAERVWARVSAEAALAATGDAGALMQQWWAQARDAAWGLVKRIGD